MRYLKSIIIFILLITLGCNEIDTLPRKNPLDVTHKSILIFTKYSVFGTNDSIPKNTYAHVKIFVKNIGKETAKNVNATFKYLNNDTDLTVFSNSANFGDIASNSEVYGTSSSADNWSLVLFVNGNTASGSKKDFEMNLTDSKNNTWCDTISFTIK